MNRQVYSYDDRHSIVTLAVTSSESSVGISATSLNMSQENDQVGPDSFVITQNKDINQ